MRELIEQIVVGELSPGEMLPREVDLAESYGISRGVARETIRGLEERGLISVKHGRGATVTEPSHWDVLDPDVFAASLAGPRRADVLADQLEVQRLLEVEAAGLAARRRRDDDLAEVTGALDAMATAAPKAPDSPSAASRYDDAHLAFHQGIARASGNGALARLTAPLYRAMASAPSRPGTAADLRAELREHRRILAALDAGDGEAASGAMAAHLRAEVRRLRRRD
ncbi:MAG: GntR domain protein [Conexibacter sp.]|nr:GntR domain protein [Conexibacter sp.]